MFAADFFFAFDQDFDLQRKLAYGCEPRLDAFDVRKHLAFVVGGATGVEVAVADGRLEGGADPLVDRVGRLDVVVAVDQRDGGTGDRGGLGVDQRMAGGFDLLDGKAKTF